MKLAGLILIACPLLAAGPTPTGFPFTNETLNYAITWPSGMNLGEGKLSATRTGDKWNFELSLDAPVPVFPVKDKYHSVSNLSLCAAEFTRDTSHGPKKVSEKTTIAGGAATRETLAGGGKTEISVPACAHDALTFLFFTRQELGQGRVPPAQSILFGGEYKLQLNYSGAQYITINEASVQADRVQCTVTSQKSSYQFEMFFARDAARTPLLIRAPFALGAISMELVR
jgi:hypothetical protein